MRAPTKDHGNDVSKIVKEADIIENRIKKVHNAGVELAIGEVAQKELDEMDVGWNEKERVLRELETRGWKV